MFGVFVDLVAFSSASASPFIVVFFSDTVVMYHLITTCVVLLSANYNVKFSCDTTIPKYCNSDCSTFETLTITTETEAVTTNKLTTIPIPIDKPIFRAQFTIHYSIPNFQF